MRAICIGECMVELRPAGEALYRRGFAGDVDTTAVYLKCSAPALDVQFATVTGADSLRKAGVKAVALVAGEVGTEIASETKTQEELERAGFPAKLFVMSKAGHLYGDDMERIMADALAFVLAH